MKISLIKKKQKTEVSTGYDANALSFPLSVGRLESDETGLCFDKRSFVTFAQHILITNLYTHVRLVFRMENTEVFAQK